MKTFVCVLLMAASAAAQAPAEAAQAKSLNAAPDFANAAPNPAPADPSAVAGGNPELRPGVPNYGPAFFGAGLSPRAIRPSPLLVRQYQDFASRHPNLRIRVDLDGSLHPVNEFGVEDGIEVEVDALGRLVLNPEAQLEALQEAQELERERQEIGLRRQEQELVAKIRQLQLQLKQLESGAGNLAVGAHANPVF